MDETGYAYAYMDMNEDGIDVSMSDSEDEYDEGGDAKVLSAGDVAGGLDRVHVSVSLFKRDREKLSHRWDAMEREFEVLPQFDVQWDILRNSIIGRVDALVFTYAFSNEVEDKFLHKEVRLEQLHPLGKDGLTSGAFGDVFLADWGEKKDAKRVFVKRQELDEQFAVEVATLVFAGEHSLPTPRLLALSLGSGPEQGLQVDDTRAVMVMQPSPGAPADKFFASRNASPKVRHLFCAMSAFALKCSHALGIVHNDVALRNYMTDADKCFQLIDFGLSVVAKETASVPVPYVHSKMPVLQSAPEMLLNRRCSAASDVWQLGWMLLEVYTGEDQLQALLQPLWDKARALPSKTEARAAAEKEFVDAVRSLRPAPPSEKVCPPDVFALILRCLSPSPSARPKPDELIAAALSHANANALSEALCGSSSASDAYVSLLAHGDAVSPLLDSFSPKPLSMLQFSDLSRGRVNELRMIADPSNPPLHDAGAKALETAFRSAGKVPSTVVLSSHNLSEEQALSLRDTVLEMNPSATIIVHERAVGTAVLIEQGEDFLANVEPPCDVSRLVMRRVEDEMHRIKLVVVGSNTENYREKTRMLLRFTEPDRSLDAYVPTVFDNYSNRIEVHGQPVNIGLWDTSGQENYDRLRPLSYAQTKVFIMTYSLHVFSTVADLENIWVKDVAQHAPDAPVLLVGVRFQPPNEPERPECVSNEHIYTLIRSLSHLQPTVNIAAHMIVDLNTDENINEAFHTALLLGVNRFFARTNSSTSSCCSLM